MNDTDSTKPTLEDLDGRWPDPGSNASRLIKTVHRLRRVPLSNLGAEDLRLLISQRVGIEHLLPYVFEVLRHTPLAAGDLYPGDLLIATLRTIGPELSPDRRRELLYIVEYVRAEKYTDAPKELWPLVDSLQSSGNQ